VGFSIIGPQAVKIYLIKNLGAEFEDILIYSSTYGENSWIMKYD
jgi:hypothetical protein